MLELPHKYLILHRTMSVCLAGRMQRAARAMNILVLARKYVAYTRMWHWFDCAIPMSCRQDAAAQLERKMAAMEACLAARRVIAQSPEPPKSAAEMMAEQMKAAVAAPPPVSSTGPAAGNGKEVLLQVGRRVYS
jgi:hypothetical protein